MAFVPVADVANLRIRQRLYNQQVENGFYIRNPSGWDPTTLTALVTSALSSWSARVMPILSDDLSVVGAYAVDLTSSTAPSIEDTLETPVDGGVASAADPGNVAFVVSFRTAERGRSRRGRIYISGIPASRVTGNQVQSTFASGVVTAIQGFIADLTVAESFGTHVQVSRVGGVGVATPVINIGFTDLNIDSQRRRLTTRGT